MSEEAITARGFRQIAENPEARASQLRTALKAAADRVTEAVLNTRATHIELELALKAAGLDPEEARQTARRRVQARLNTIRGEDPDAS